MSKRIKIKAKSKTEFMDKKTEKIKGIVNSAYSPATLGPSGSEQQTGGEIPDYTPWETIKDKGGNDKLKVPVPIGKFSSMQQAIFDRSLGAYEDHKAMKELHTSTKHKTSLKQRGNPRSIKKDPKYRVKPDVDLFRSGKPSVARSYNKRTDETYEWTGSEAAFELGVSMLAPLMGKSLITDAFGDGIKSNNPESMGARMWTGVLADYGIGTTRTIKGRV